MRKHWTRTIPAGLAAALVVFATMDARATVVFSQSDVGVSESPVASVVIDSTFYDVVRETMLGLISDDFQFNDPGAERRSSPEVAHALTPLSDMSPPPSTYAGGAIGVGGYALAGEVTLPTTADMQASLAPEARLVLPTGPPYRWFRPPRQLIDSRFYQ